MSLHDAGDRFLIPAKAKSLELVQQAREAAASLDVLTAESAVEALEAAARAERLRLRNKGAELALRLIVARLEEASQPAADKLGLEVLVKTAVQLDPDSQGRQTGNTNVLVSVVYKEEGRKEGVD